MNCKQMDELAGSRFAHSGGALPEPAQHHLRGCKRCRDLYEFLNQELLSPPPEPLRGLEERIRARLVDSLEPVSPLPSSRVLVGAFMGVFSLLLLLVLGIMGVRALHVMKQSQAVGVGALIGAAVLLASVSLSRQMVPGSYQKMSPKTLIVLLLVLLTSGLVLLFPWENTGMFVKHGVPCLSRGLMVTVPAAALFWLMVRRGAVLAPEWAGASTGLLSGLVALAVLQLNCMVLESPHIAFWHVGVVIASTAAGFLFGRILRSRASWNS